LRTYIYKVAKYMPENKKNENSLKKIDSRLRGNDGDGQIKRICAWCGDVMGYKPGNAVVYKGVKIDMTHGICEACEAEVKKEIEGHRINGQAAAFAKASESQTGLAHTGKMEVTL
jgi:hypothetical protein